MRNGYTNQRRKRGNITKVFRSGSVYGVHVIVGVLAMCIILWAFNCLFELRGQGLPQRKKGVLYSRQYRTGTKSTMQE